MEIRLVTADRKQHIGLLLLADEQESMVERYIDCGDMFALYDGEEMPFAVCIVTNEGDGVYEIKNIATVPAFQRRGYGRTLIDYLFWYYRDRGRLMLVGTGESELTLPFYYRCGFLYSHRIPGFFIDYYDHPIYEGGRLLTDMVYLCRDFPC